MLACPLFRRSEKLVLCHGCGSHRCRANVISMALVLDIDLHFGDGTVNIHNPSERSREQYLYQVGHILSGVEVDLIGISAGFDNHIDDWGGLLETEDYF